MCGLHAGLAAFWQNRSVSHVEFSSPHIGLTLNRLNKSLTIENVAARDPSSAQLIVSHT